MKNRAPRLTDVQYACNFADIQKPLTSAQAFVESSRCLFCFEAPCITACPTHIDVPSFIQKIRNENVRGAARVILDANPLGASCARVCPVEVLCEGACVLHHNLEKPVEIGRLQRFATDWYFERGMPALFPLPPANGHRVALVGAGPASLGCAAALRRLGYAAVVFDRNPEPGGLNTYGIAQYKMTPEDSLREIEFVRSLGAEFRCGVEVGTQLTLDSLRQDHDAVFLGIGLGGTHRLEIPGADKNGVVDALHFIRDYKTRPYGDVPVGRRVAVIGGGNTAIDAATAAVRLGAERTWIVYRRSEAEMPAFHYEIELAKRDGVVFQWLAAPSEILGDGGVAGLRCQRMRLGPPDARGRARPEPVPGSDFVLEVDMVIAATGQEKLGEWLGAIQGLALDGGRVMVDAETGMTSVPGLFAGGDCANGGLEVVNAVAEGTRAAFGIDAWMRSR
jgi:dihydropyrimidine dehydrogenase (NAD+) subunit PreT